ncbi:GNAT family N-acetyltransferase [Rhodococcus sp. OK302]|uniref:GNAT family N-acetyltransferase n=1 Tax=Rhodococcus sp. OK302 TaxID=1882769 RepID=UPI000B9F4C46|nr:GNAT family N-acetyltransferase [Rhodococcus sp. OK302]OYD60746.1 RimJ/RimL family protein N-acetyltransferase [Rhodococcus sp. OK302]
MSRRTILSTDRLTVTQWLPEDFDDLLALHSDPLTMRFIGYGRPDTHGEARSRLDGYLDEQQIRGWTKWRVENRDGEMIGRAGFGEVDGCRELAYAFRRDQWGRGFATEIAGALVDWHLEHPAPELSSCGLCAHVEVGNHASVRVLEKVRFEYVDTRVYVGVDCDLFRLPVEDIDCPST